MASNQEKELEEHLAKALEEIGEITPWFDQEFNAWIFSHKNYPVEYEGNSKQEVVKNYPLYLKEFIKHRLENRLAPLMEKKTKGHGGKREGAGRPKGSKKEETVRIYVPKEIAKWLKTPGTIAHMQQVLETYRHLQR